MILVQKFVAASTLHLLLKCAPSLAPVDREPPTCIKPPRCLNMDKLLQDTHKVKCQSLTVDAWSRHSCYR